MGRIVQLTATEPQMEFLALDCKFPAFVGGFGSGKTQTMILSAIRDASYHKDALIALYAPTYDLVQLIIAQRLLETLNFLNIEYDYNKTANTIKTKSNQFGNFILRSLDSPERIVGYQSFRAHIDELDILSKKQAEEAWNKIIARNRQKLPGKPLNRVSAYTTPEGFKFTYDRWVKNARPSYKLIKCSSRSNPTLPDDYISSLEETYPAQLIEAYIEGEFVNLNSGTVYSSFDRYFNSSSETVQPNEPIHIGMDFNVGKMAATIFVMRKDGIHAVDEIKDLLDTPAMITEIKRRYHGRKIFVYPDSTGKSRKAQDASSSDIALLNQAGFNVRATSVNPPVRNRILAVNTALEKRKFYVNIAMCPTVADCLEQQAYADNGEPDKKAGKDHQNDATGYAIVYLMPVKRPVFDINVEYPI